MRDSTWEVGVLGRAPSRFPAVPVLPLAASIVGCGSDASTSPASVGTVSGQVLDENEVGVEGASLTLSRPGFPERQTASGEDGTFTFPEVEAGVWELRVDPPAGLEPAPGQEEVFEVPVTANRTATLIVSLRRIPASGWELLAGSPTPPDGHTRHADIHFLDAERGWLVNASGRIYRTRDGGATWENITDRAAGPEPVGVCGIWVQDDGGATWDVVFESAATGKWAWRISFPTADVGYTATQGPTPDGVVLKTTDGGRGWEELVVNDGLGFSGIGFATPDLGWIGGGGTTWKTTDGGATWREVGLDPVLNRFRMMGPALGFAVGSRVYRYTGGNEGGS